MSARRILLARHGQYVRDPERLTDLGRAQAACLGDALRSVPLRRMVSSEMPRALETADIVAHHHPDAERSATSLLNERATFRPRITTPWVKRVPHHVWESGPASVEAMASLVLDEPKGDGIDLYVFHGNMIRSLVVWAMGLEQASWADLRVHHCGLTELQISAGARRSLVMVNSVGHLPRAMQTQT